MGEAFGQTETLYGEDLLAAAAAVAAVVRHEGRRVDRTVECRLCCRGKRNRNPAGRERCAVVGECVAPHTLAAQKLYVDICRDDLLLGREAVALDYHRAVLGDKAVAGEDQIGGRLAEARRDIYVCRRCACRLLPHERGEVGVFAYGLGRGRQVEYHLGARGGLVRRRGYGHPQILAYLHAAPYAVDDGLQVGAEGYLTLSDGYVCIFDFGARGEPPCLVELGIVGYVAFGYGTEIFAACHYNGAVVYGVSVAQRCADDGRDGNVTRGRGNAVERLGGGIEQLRLQEQVAACVCRDAQLRKGHDTHAARSRTPHQHYNVVGIEAAVCDPDGGHGRRNLEISVSIHIVRCQSLTYAFSMRSTYAL